MKKNYLTLILCLIITFLLSAGSGCFAVAQESVKGITEPFNDSTLSATVSGTIARINRKEGETVKQGEIILELESGQEALEVGRRKLIAESKAEVDSAKNQVETLKLDLDGTRKLFETTKSVSHDDLRKKELEYKLAEGELKRLLIAEEREEIEYRIAQAELEKRRISAPFDGMITKLFLKIAENCNPQQPLVRIVDTRKCRFVAYVDAAESWQLKSGKQVNLIIDDAEPPVKCKGVVEYVSPVVDPSSGLQEVKVLFDNPEGKVRPGVNAKMNLEERK